MKKCLECENDIIKGKFCSKKCSAQHRSKNTCAISNDDLIREYEIDRLELSEIALNHNVSVNLVCNYLKKYNIQKRTNYIDFSGKKIGNLTVIGKATTKRGNGKHIKWHCLCDCGNNIIVFSHHLSRSVFPKCTKCSRLASRSELELKNFMWNNIKRSALNRNLEFSLKREWAYELFLMQNKKCALSGVDIEFATCTSDYNKGLTTASLDRINSLNGYTIDNVQWIHKTINIMKNTLTTEQLFEWCQKIVQNNALTPTCIE